MNSPMKTNPNFDAVIFDLDGVITNTASLHSQAWKEMFDAFLAYHAEQTDTPFQEFTHEDDYLPYVDGKPRYKGVASFLESRGISLPYGSPDDPPGKETICQLGNRKNQIYNDLISTQGVDVYQSTVALLEDLKALDIPLGVASSSKNTLRILEVTGLKHFFQTRVDGVVSAELGLHGKPHPDIFTTACDNLGGSYDRSVVVEDAISGVQAGKNGNFGLVIGVAREDNSLELYQHGADIVVEDMGEVSVQDLRTWFSQGLKERMWSLHSYGYRPEEEGSQEALYTIGNGYFGTRGALEETSANDINYPGTYIAGMYNRLPSLVSGRTVYNEDFVNCPNWLPITFKIDQGPWFNPNEVEVLDMERFLDFQTGTLNRTLKVRDEQGRETLLVSQRFASMADAHLAALQYQIIPLNYEAKITVRMGLDGTVINYGVERYRELSSQHLDPIEEGWQEDRLFLLVETNQSNIKIAEAARHKVMLDDREFEPAYTHSSIPGAVYSSFSRSLSAGETLTCQKIVSLYSSNISGIDTPLMIARKHISRVSSYETLLQASSSAWEGMWKKIDIQVKGDRQAQQLLRLHLYHLLVTTSPHTNYLDVGIPARGLHGEAYRGHIFWDEVFVMPFYDLHFPDTARSALMYRYNRLGEAQKYARDHGYQGSIFPWQSGSSGREETQVLHLNPISGDWGPDFSSLQRHVSLAIAYNIWEYIWITDDLEFLAQYGGELFLDICRFWSSKADYDQEKDRYSINNIMGPDEFHEKYPDALEGGLRNNTYTNLLVAWVFQRAIDLLDMLPEREENHLRERISLKDQEIEHWLEISQNLEIPLSEEGILEQFEGYFELEELDWNYYREKYDDIHRMDRILKAENKSPDHYKVAKQADTLMIFYLLSEGKVQELLERLNYQVPENFFEKNFHYYLKRTSHGSTLSRLVHAYLAHLIGEEDLSETFFMEALTSDYQDIQGGTTAEGIHVGVMAGTVLYVIRALGGLNWENGYLILNPHLPPTWRELSFNFGFKGSRYYVKITPEQLTLLMKGEEPRLILVHGQEHELTPGERVKIAR